MVRRVVEHEPDATFWATPKVYIGEGVAYPLYVKTASGFVVPKFYDGNTRNFSGAIRSFDFPLRDHQKQPVENTVQELALKQGTILRAGCGWGKTSCGLVISKRLSNRTIILVDQLNIAEQWLERIRQFLPESKAVIYSGSHESLKDAKASDAEYKIIVAQALARQDWIEDPITCDLLIVDEAHVFSAPSFVTAIHNVDYTYSLGLTATDDRKDGLDWVFRWFLGQSVVEAPAVTLEGKIISPVCNITVKDSDYYQAFCVKKKKFTYHANCRECEFYANFPKKCGGCLPTVPFTNIVKWDQSRINFQGLVKGLITHPDYTAFSLGVINKILSSGRNAFVFCQFKDALKNIHAALDNPNVGIYIGDSRDKLALKKPVTLTTYAMSNKALDVPEKDTAFIFSPASDIRQTVGRISRFLEGKRTPTVIDPIITSSMVLSAMRKRRMKQYKELGFKEPK